MFRNYDFSLMNKDKKILTFHSDVSEHGPEHGVKFTEIKSLDEMRPVGYKNIGNWIADRQAPKHREHMEKLLKACGCYDLDGFIRVSHALSLNDTFWIKPAHSDLIWNEVSLYKNPFDETISRIAFEGGLYGEQMSSTSPEYETSGSFAKCWVRNEQNIILLKQGSHGFKNAGLEPYSEYYASQVSKEICEDYIAYDLTKFRGELVSACPLFTSEAYGFVPIYRLFEDKNFSLDDVLNKLDAFGVADKMKDMLVLDALILNTDRHAGNYGVLIENSTQEIVDFAPVFDNNMSLLPYAMEDDLMNIKEYIATRPTRLGQDFNKTAHTFLTDHAKEMLPKLEHFKFQRHPKYNLPESRLCVLEKMIQDQAKDIQRGTPLYKIGTIDDEINRCSDISELNHFDTLDFGQINLPDIEER